MSNSELRHALVHGSKKAPAELTRDFDAADRVREFLSDAVDRMDAMR